MQAARAPGARARFELPLDCECAGVGAFRSYFPLVNFEEIEEEEKKRRVYENRAIKVLCCGMIGSMIVDSENVLFLG